MFLKSLFYKMTGLLQNIFGPPHNVLNISSSLAARTQSKCILRISIQHGLDRRKKFLIFTVVCCEAELSPNTLVCEVSSEHPL